MPSGFRRARRALLALLFVAVPALVASCSQRERLMADFRMRYGAGDFAAAEASIDELIAEEAGVSKGVVETSRGLDATIDADEGDLPLFLLEKALVRLAQEDRDASVDLLRSSRDELDERTDLSLSDFFSTITDDTGRPFRAADYEIILIRALLAIIDLVAEGKDAYSYALQIGEKQEELLGGSFGEGLVDADGNQVGYNPRKQYNRLAIGAYLEGLLLEESVSFDSAAKAYRRASDWAGNPPFLAEALARVDDGRYAPEGAGIVHLFYVAGRGPLLGQTTSPITDLALVLAKAYGLASGNNIELLGQAPVPVPTVVVRDSQIAPLYLELDDGTKLTTSKLLDVNRVAQEQLDANMPWIIARAVVRRVLKGAVATAVRKGVERGGHQSEGTADFFGFLTSLLLTASEDADTRIWSALPAEIHCARLALPAGVHTIDLGQGMSKEVRVGRGQDSYVLVIRPNLGVPGVILVDEFSAAPSP